MKFNDCRQHTIVSFEQLKIGDCFCYKENFFMVIDNNNKTARTIRDYNTICFNDNQLYYFYENDEIEVVRGELKFYSK